MINCIRPSGAYEQRAHQALAGAVKPGDVVWDIGANVGVYTELFCQWVGENGFVVAFEPLAESCERIRERLPHCGWLQVENVALGEEDCAGRLVTGAESVENHIETAADSPDAVEGSVPVLIRRGDEVCDRLGRVPNLIKVDVEGFEEEVLNGMKQTLTSPALRNILVEVHFLKLERRGRLTAPSRIQQLLESAGFKTKWVDTSHLFAAR